MEEQGESTFKAFYYAEYVRVFRATYLFSGDREVAFDATQEAFKDALVRWRSLEETTWVGAWVMTVAMNRCRRQWRQRKREQTALRKSESGKHTSLDPASETSVDLIAALQRLPARQRQATILYYIADLPIPVVAERMGLHEGSVKAHLAQARKRLRNLMEVRHV